jgi:hypothetical protein
MSRRGRELTFCIITSASTSHIVKGMSFLTPRVYSGNFMVEKCLNSWYDNEVYFKIGLLYVGTVSGSSVSCFSINMFEL